MSIDICLVCATGGEICVRAYANLHPRKSRGSPKHDAKVYEQSVVWALHLDVGKSSNRNELSVNGYASVQLVIAMVYISSEAAYILKRCEASLVVRRR